MRIHAGMRHNAAHEAALAVLELIGVKNSEADPNSEPRTPNPEP
jgi:hypothetical protein